MGNGVQASLNLLDQAGLGTPATSTITTVAAAAGDTKITVASVAGFAAGSAIKVTAAAVTENATVSSIAGSVITLGAALANPYPIGATVDLVVASTQQTTLVATALQEGVAGNSTTVKIDAASLGTAKAVTPSTTLSAAAAVGATTVTLASATGFQPGAAVTLTSGPTKENANIVSITGTTATLAAGLANAYPAGATFAASLAVGVLQVQVDSVTGFQPGSYVKFSNGAAPDSFDVVRVVNPVSKTLTLTNGLTNAYPSSPAVAVTTIEFTLTVKSITAGTEVFPGLAMDSRHSQYYLPLVTSKAVSLDRPRRRTLRRRL